MRSVRSVALAALAFTMLGASVASAQRRPAQRTSTAEGFWELGMDAALMIATGDPGVTTLSVPVQNVRLGYFFTPEWALEPFFSLDYVNIEDGGSIATYQLGTGLLYHFSTVRTASQLYVRPFVGFVGVNVNPEVGASDSETDVFLGGGLGMKWPRLGGRAALRGEVNVGYAFDAEQMTVGVQFGLSFFTR
jgi:hypothetical protein